MSKDWKKEYERLWTVSSSGIILNAKLKIFIEDLLQQQQEKHMMELALLESTIEQRAIELAYEKLQPHLDKQQEKFIEMIGEDEEENWCKKEGHKYSEENGFCSTCFSSLELIEESVGRNKLRQQLREKL